MEIIGLSGYARSGKDEAAKVLVEEFGFTRVAFADKLRDFLYALNPIVALVDYPDDVKGKTWKTQSGNEEPLLPWTYSQPYKTVQSVIDEYGWDGYKETVYGTEIRRLLQRLGTEAGRQTLWDSIWIDAALTGHPEDAKLVVSDSRFINEFDAITDRGGRILRIEREGVGPANNHASELEALQYNFPVTIHNDGTLEDYHNKIREFASALGL